MPVLQDCKQSNHIRLNNGCALYFVAAEKRYGRICGRGKDGVGRIHGSGLIDMEKKGRLKNSVSINENLFFRRPLLYRSKYKIFA